MAFPFPGTYAVNMGKDYDVIDVGGIYWIEIITPPFNMYLVDLIGVY